MSEGELWTGIAKVIKPQESEDLEAMCKRMCEKKGFVKSEYAESYAETLIDNGHKELALADGNLYDVTQLKDHDYDDVCEATKLDDDTISVTLKFYNGGTCFTEMFEEAVTKMNNSDD